MINDKLLQIKNILLSDTINPLSVNTSNDIIEEKTVYHGSPYDFKKFLLDYIGNGEGDQVYGWGLYFADDNEIANNVYRIKLTDSKYDNKKEWNFGININGIQYKYFDKENVWKDNQNNIIDIININRENSIEFITKFILKNIRNSNYNLAKFKKALVNALEGRPNKDFDNFKKMLDLINNSKIKMITNDENYGQLFEVDIPDDDELLDWDKKINDQNEKIIDILRKIENDFKINTIIFGSGHDIYKELSTLLGSEKKASMKLLEYGIKGLQYYDGESRNTSKNNHNYVIWDENSIKIINKYYE